MAVWNANQARLELPSGDGRQQLRAVAKEFESLFVKQMLDSMRATLNKENNLLDGGMAENIFEDMLYDEYSRMIASTGSLGVAELIYSQYSDRV